MDIIKNYKSSLILLLAVVAGGIAGLVLGERASVIAPLGNLFLNLIFTLLIPLVFFSISSAIAGIDRSVKIGKAVTVTIVVFCFTALISGIIAILSFVLFNPAKGIDHNVIISMMQGTEVSTEASGIFSKVIAAVSVEDFVNILSRKNLLALVIFSVLTGVAALRAGDEGRAFVKFLNSGSAVCNKIMELIMYYAPIGLGAYFANVVGSLGTQIISGYVKVFLLYLIVSILYFIIFFTLYAYIAGRREGVKLFWRNAAGPSLTAIATCSSAACIPINIESAIKMKVPENIAKIIMPIGVNIHKDGSIMGGIFKTMFLFTIFGRSFNNLNTLTGILMAGLFIGLLVGAIPIGGSIGEMLILSIFGFPPEALAIMIVIATIIDAPATLLNSAGNTVCTMMISGLMRRKEKKITG